MLILVADDDTRIRDVLRHIFELHGHQVIEASCGADAVALARSRPPAVFVFDLVMPNGGGLETIELLRADQRFARTPMVLVTALTGDEIDQRAAASGATACFSKPFSPLALAQFVDSLAGVG